MNLNKVFGCIYGLAIGDALGFPNEFIDIDSILLKNNGLGTIDFENLYKERPIIIGDKKIGGKIEFPAGTYSDDTQMSLAVARALLNSNLKKYDLEEIMQNITKEFISWYNDPTNNRAPGRTCLKGAYKLNNGINWKNSGDISQKGCGTAMRSAPIGLIFHNDITKLVEVASAASKCTHAHPTAVSSGIATAYLTSLAVNGINPKQYIDNILSQPFFNEEMKNKIFQVSEVLALENTLTARQKLGKGWVGDEAVALALYCVLKNSADYVKTVLMAANSDGDTDSIACIAGAISGAYNGIEKIPAKWVTQIENSRYLCEIAKNLYHKTK